MVSVRSATIDDCRQYFDWANDPVVRAASFHTAAIEWDEHVVWFRGRLASSAPTYVVVNDVNAPVGQVRFDARPDGAMEIGVSLDARFRGQRLAAEAVAAACRALRADGRTMPIIAHVRPENAASLAAFRGAGFDLAGTSRIGDVEAVRLELTARPAFSGPVLFRVDAGPGIGLGHLQRCLALAEACGRLGATAVFLSPLSADVRQRIEAAGCEARSLDLTSEALGSAADCDYVIRSAKDVGAATVVVDSYAVKAHYLAELRAAGLRVVFIDDLAHEPLPAHIVINAGAQATSLGYRSSTGDTRFLLGVEYALLRRHRDAGPRPIGDVQRVLVTVGGDDPRCAMTRLIDLVARSAGEFSVIAAVGPFSAQLVAVREAARHSTRNVDVVVASMGLSELIAQTDLAISAAGQTLYELAANGTPTIAVELFDNQTGSLSALAEAGVVKSVGRFGDREFDDRFIEALSALVQDRDARHRLSVTARTVVDGRGAERVAAAVMAA